MSDSSENLNKLAERADNICEYTQLGVNSLNSQRFEQTQFNRRNKKLDQSKLQIYKISKLVRTGSSP